MILVLTWIYDIPFFQAVLVHNSETIRIKYFMDLLMAQLRPVMLVGNAGTGKSVLVNNKLSNLDEEDYVVANVPFNYYTTSQMLQSTFFLFCFYTKSISYAVNLVFSCFFNL